jgi:DNA invertase Pin-like site-specific DNA recombinase
LDRLLKDATARRINTIAAWSVDRLGRSLQLAMRNKNNAILYYLFFAAANRTADKIIRDIFARYRS